jgi:flagellar biosynthetic protein FliR
MITLTFDQLWQVFTLLWWPLVRIMAMIMTAPIFSSPAMPARSKILLGLLLAFIVSPLVEPAPKGSDFLALLLQNMLTGAIIGFSLRVIFSAIEFAGDIVGLQTGLGFAMLMDPMSSRQTPLIGTYFGLLGTLIFLSLNGHLLLIVQVVDSFQVVPLSGSITGGFNFLSIAAWGAELFKIGLVLSLPMVLVLLIVNLALGLMARIAPQLSIFSIGFSLSLIVGLLLIWLVVPYLGSPLERLLTTPLWTQAH